MGLEIQEILVDCYQHICTTRYGRAQYGQIVGISATLRMYFSRFYCLGRTDDGLVNFRNLAVRKAEFFFQLPDELVEDVIGDHPLVIHQNVFEKVSAHAGAADVSRDEH